MKISTRFALASVALVVLGACGGDTPIVGPVCPRVEIPVMIGDTVVTESGLRHITTEEGEGDAAQANDEVTVHYTGYLTDGTVFDSSQGRPPSTFPLDRVIDGFAEGITGMRVGGIRRLIIPPQLGYGASPPRGSCIPPNATLIFDVELLDIIGG